MKKVLCTIPTDERKKECLPEFAENLRKSVIISGADIIFINTGDVSYGETLKEYVPEAKVIHYVKPDDMVLTKWMYELREKQRKLFLESDCDYMLMLDSDVMMTREAYAKSLYQMVLGRHWVGPWYSMGRSVKGVRHAYCRPLCAKTTKIKQYDEGGLDIYSYEDLMFMEEMFECSAIPLGCSFVDKKIMEALPFEYCHIMPVGEDIMFYGNAEEKGFIPTCINIELDHYSNGVSVAYYGDKNSYRVEFVRRQGDDICKQLDLTKLRKTQ